MRFEAVRGRWIAVIAVVLAASACSPQCGRMSKLPATTPLAAIPSPSPTPTAPLQASSLPFHAGEVGVVYGPVALTGSGGVAPYAWSISAGALPGGLTLGADGSVSGTPSASGSFSFTVQLSDAHGGNASLTGVIAVAPALSASLIPACAQYCKVELGCVNACGSFGNLSGGVGPFGYNLTQGQLPAGTSLSGLSLTGKFVGLSGYLKFTVQVTDSMGATSTISPTFWMYDHISLAGGSCAGNYGTGCSAKLPITGGVPGSPQGVSLVSVAPNPSQGCWNPNATTPPPGYGLSVSGGNVVVTIPNRILSGYAAVWTLTVNDQTPCSASTNCTSNEATVVIGVQCG
ncbi:MAG TPA: Ig-like domain-containing protein [Candidatus Dormibacteraeota bacterium]|nr:Ig-like domain-containing protein [Candidatus Dormibacteraeota bacterium]